MASEKPDPICVSVTETTSPMSVAETTRDEFKQSISDPENTQQQAKTLKQFLLGWLVESIAIFAAAASHASLTVMLFVLDGKKISQLPFKLELATVMSIIAKVTEATVGLVVAACLSQIMWIRYRSRARPLNDFAVYDAATRGARGQAIFLLQSGHNIKGYVGVAIALLALGLGPSYQQTVRYETINGNATLARCFKSVYTDGSAADSVYNALHLALYYDINAVGSAQDGVLQSLNTGCSTGNCTWPVFPSLGICGTCQDASDAVVQDCRPRVDKLLGEVIGCRASLPSINNNTVITNYTDPVDGHMLAAMSPNTNGSLLGSVYGNAVSYNFASMRYSKGDAIHASSCVLYYCVRGYQSVVNNSNLVEKVTDSWSDPNASKVLGDVYHAFDNVSDLIGPGYDVVLTPTPSSGPGLNLSKPTNFTMDWYTDTHLQQYFAQIFNGTYYISFTNKSKSSQYSGNTGQEALVMQIYNNLWGADSPQQDMGRVLNGLALEMSDALRHTCNTTDYVQGTAKNLYVALHIAWLWLIFPGVLILMTMGFLIAVILESYRRGSLIWKTGIFPLLFHGMHAGGTNPDAKDNSGGPAGYRDVSPQMSKELEAMTGMEKHARVMHVQLERGDSGTWRLANRQQ